MNGQFFPADAFYVPDGQGGSLPLWHAFFENPGLVQFMHRMVGYLLLIFGVVVWNRGRKSVHGPTRMEFHAVMVMLLAQVFLGIATALTAVVIGGVPFVGVVGSISGRGQVDERGGGQLLRDLSALQARGDGQEGVGGGDSVAEGVMR